MCGIGGLVGRGPPDVAREALDRAVASMDHRGPGDSGLWLGQARGVTASLCATRLAIQDLSPRGHQPMVSSRTGGCIVFNGELYNAAALRQQLEREGCSFEGTSDTEVTLAAWDSWGPE